MENNNIGSIWRKWDLHCHAPGTKIKNEFGQCNDEAFKKWFDILVKKEIAVVGVTDYFSFDCYFKAKKFQNKNKGYGHITLLPNLELRLQEKNSDKDTINFHILLSNDVDDKLETLLRVLKYEKIASTSLPLIDFKEDDYNRASLSREHIIKTVKEFIPEDSYLFIGVASGYGNERYERKSDPSRSDKIAEIIDSHIQAFFGNKKATDFYLNKDENKRGLPPKPVFQCSDAHQFEGHDDANPGVGDKYTWVKSDTTFEGLLQTLHNPEDRVKIQDGNPLDDRLSTYLKKITLKPKKEGLFEKKEIELNPYLNTIIGARSSGKSLLLTTIASSLSEGTSNYLYTREIEESKEKYDGDLTQLEADIELSEEKTPLPITYIHQNMLAGHTQNNWYINNIIIDVLKRSNDKFDLTVRKFHEEIKKNNNTIRAKISELSEIKNKIEYFNQEKQSIGFSEEDLNSKIKELSFKLSKGLSDEEKQTIETYENLLQTLQLCRNEKNQHINFLSQLNHDFESFLNKYDLDLSYKELKDIYIKTQEDIEQKQNEILSKDNEKIEQIEKICETNKTRYESIIKNIGDQDTLKNNLKELQNMERNLQEIKNQLNYYNIRKEALNKEVHGILADKNKLIDELNVQISETIANPDNEQLKIKINYIADGLKPYIDESVDKRSKEIPKEINSIEEEISMGNVRDILIILKDILTLNNVSLDYLKKNFTPLEFVTEILACNVILKYELSFNNKNIKHMSPGEKSVTILRFILKFDNGKYPILMDQPEDNLDNKAIYDDLAMLIKENKNKRQIIIATHNPNLVIGTNAENVIVAENNIVETHTKITYTNGAIENKSNEIKQSICDIMEGGKEAFEKRNKSYKDISN